MHRLAIISTHPIQYNAPWFAMLEKESDMKIRVFYTWSQRRTDLRDLEFAIKVEWDIPLLEGYESVFVENRSTRPGNRHYKGIVCPLLIDEIESWKPDHLLVFGWNFQAHFKAMRYFKGKIPVLFRGDSTLLDDTNLMKSRIRKLVLKQVYRNLDIALNVGISNRDYFLAFGISRLQLFHVPHAIDNERFFKDPSRTYSERVQQWKEELNIGASDRVILFAGKLTTKKNPEILIRAYSKLQKEGQDSVKLVIIGDGPLKAGLETLASGIPGISFLPFQNQSLMPAVYRLGNIFCLSSSGPGETWGLAVNEAMASGTPCLISDRAGCAADLGVYPGNQVFQSGNPEDLADKLSQMLQNPEFDNSSFLENWNYQKMVQGLKQAIKPVGS